MTKVSISQEGIDPINIEMEQEKSQESTLAVIGISIGAFFVLGIVSAIIGNAIDNAKFKKAYKSCSEEEQKKIKAVFNEICNYIESENELFSKSIFDKFKTKITNDDSKISKFGSIDKSSFNIHNSSITKTDKIDKKLLDSFNYRSFIYGCKIEALPDIVDFFDKCSSYEDSLNSQLNATNIDDTPKNIQYTPHKPNRFFTKSYYTTVYNHSSKNPNEFINLQYTTSLSFVVNKAEMKKEIGFFLNKIK